MPPPPFTPPEAKLAPAKSEARWIWYCLIGFGVSFAFDFRVDGTSSSDIGGSFAQYLMAFVALISGSTAAFLGRRYLLVRPGVYFIAAWFGYLAFAGTSALLQGVGPSWIARLMLAPILIGLGMVTVHVAACAGVPARQIVKVFLAICVLNIFWQTSFAYATSDESLLATRPELSPGIRFVFAWSACALLLARKIPRNAVILLGLAVGVCVLCLTRSAAIYLFGAVSGALACLGLAILWGRRSLSHLTRRMGLFGGIGIGGLALIILFLAAVPSLGSWWVDRLFYSDGGGATSEDMSILMRKAEAIAMIDLLNENPASYVWGRGFGASYYWDDSFLPELALAYPDPSDYPDEVHTCGHSVWTYALFSSGIIGVVSWLILFVGPASQSIRGAFLLSRLEKPMPPISPPSEVSSLSSHEDDLQFWFFPAVALWTMFCSSFLENPFDDRLAGPLTGMAAGLIQPYLNRAWQLAQREKSHDAGPTPRLLRPTPSGLGSPFFT